MEGRFSGEAQPVYASLWRRLAAAIVDQVALTLVNVVLGIALGVTLSIFLISAGLPKTSISAFTNIIATFLGFFASWAYYAVMESSEAKATFGKMLLSIQVASVKGQRISFARASGRYWGKMLFYFLCTFISIITAGLVYFLLLPSFMKAAGPGGAAGGLFLALIIFLVVSPIVQIVGVVLFMMTSRKQLLHDLMAGTVVLKKPDGLGQIPN